MATGESPLRRVVVGQSDPGKSIGTTSSVRPYHSQSSLTTSSPSKQWTIIFNMATVEPTVGDASDSCPEQSNRSMMRQGGQIWFDRNPSPAASSSPTVLLPHFRQHFLLQIRRSQHQQQQRLIHVSFLESDGQQPSASAPHSTTASTTRHTFDPGQQVAHQNLRPAAHLHQQWQ